MGKILLFLLMSYVIIWAYIFPAPQQSLGEVSRIFYFHVPSAWVSVLAFLVSMLNGIIYLKKRDLNYDIKSSSASQIGLLFAFLATVSGSMWAKVSWGAYWNWDPRQVSIFILLLIYGAYFALRSAVLENDKKAALSAVYSILAFITVPFLVFIVPRVFESLHPATSVVDQNLKIQMSPKVSLVFFPSLVGFTILFFWIWSLQVKISQRVELKKGG
ncbi:MAG: hypothetical protein A2145_02315 [candidate division Zixibacteria bacterium RBG_16_40_9]|nr:MAG: hypothetical protein A2145_02315 [candidate division Zixibacteria bacterium RBG_16_40_9]